MPTKIDGLQEKVRVWAFRNFGKDAPSHLSAIKIMEELGELAGHYIRRLEHRAGDDLDHEAGIRDSVGDIVIALTVFCVRENIDLLEAVETAWGEVSQRNYDLRGNYANQD